MKRETIPELLPLTESERQRIRIAVTPSSFLDIRVLLTYAVQVAGFVFLFYFAFPDAQPRMVLVFAYVFATYIVAKMIQHRVLREKVVAFLASEAKGK